MMTVYSGFIQCSLCNGRGGSHVPPRPKPDPNRVRKAGDLAWKWEDCDRCKGSGRDERLTALHQAGKLSEGR